MDAVQNPTVAMIRNLRMKIYEDVQQGKMTYANAMKQVLRYAEAAAGLREFALVGQMYDMGGIVCLHFGRLSEARRHFAEAINHLESVNEPTRLGRVYNNLGEVFLLQGEYTYAEASYRKARDLTQGDLTVLPMIESNLGHTYLRLGENSQASYCFQHALGITRLDDWEPHTIVRVMTIINIQRGLAEVALLNQNFGAAWGHVREAQRVAEAGGLHQLHAQLLLTAAHVTQLDTDAPTSDTQFYKQARTIIEGETSPLALARLLLEEAHYQYQQQRRSFAQSFAEEAMAIFREHGVEETSEQIVKLLQ